MGPCPCLPPSPSPSSPFHCACRNPWVLSSKLVVKPDQLIKRRGKAGLLLLGGDWPATTAWVNERLGKDVEVDGVKGPLTHFIVEPFVPHGPSDEYYVAIQSNREGEEILFYHEVRCLSASVCVRVAICVHYCCCPAACPPRQWQCEPNKRMPETHSLHFLLLLLSPFSLCMCDGHVLLCVLWAASRGRAEPIVCASDLSLVTVTVLTAAAPSPPSPHSRCLFSLV